MTDDRAAAARNARAASVDHRDASTTHIALAGKLFREWLSADAWVRHGTYRQEAVAAHKAPLAGSILRKRKSRTNQPGDTEASFRIVGQGDVGSTSTVHIPVTWLQKIADEEVMSLSPTKKARWHRHNAPFQLTREQLKEFEPMESSPMSVDERHTPMDTSTNSVIKVIFAVTTDSSLGFCVQHQRTVQ
jgi:hypothetical protein